MWPSQLNRNLSNYEVAQKKFFGASMGLEPVASAFALQCSTSWAMETHTLEAGQSIEFVNLSKEWNTEWNDVNCGNTNEMRPTSSVWVFIAQLVEHCRANAEAMVSNPVEAPKNFYQATLQLLKLRFNCDGHILISFVFPQFTSTHSAKQLKAPVEKGRKWRFWSKNKNCSKIAEFSHTDLFWARECHPGIFFVDLRCVFEKKRAEKRRRRPLFSFV